VNTQGALRPDRSRGAKRATGSGEGAAAPSGVHGGTFKGPVAGSQTGQDATGPSGRGAAASAGLRRPTARLHGSCGGERRGKWQLGPQCIKFVGDRLIGSRQLQWDPQMSDRAAGGEGAMHVFWGGGRRPPPERAQHACPHRAASHPRFRRSIRGPLRLCCIRSPLEACSSRGPARSDANQRALPPHQRPSPSALSLDRKLSKKSSMSRRGMGRSGSSCRAQGRRGAG
jgi:hypothetical protein